MRKRAQWFRTKVEVGTGVVPRGWHFGWYDLRRRVGACCPAPLQWCARAVRELAYRVQLAFAAPPLERAVLLEAQVTHRHRQLLAEGYASGYLAGWRECFEVCLQTLEQEFLDEDVVSGVGEVCGGDKNPPRKN